MDGILSGLTSIVPVMPDQSTITDRGGVKGPPVEIMPLPSNSFMSDNATADLLNNPFNLSLDIKGYNGGAAKGGKTAGGTETQTGRTPALDDDAADAILNRAYTLSLGNEESAPVAAEIAREMSRAKNYELLGKNPARQAYRPGRGAGDPGDMAEQPDFGDTADFVSEKVRGLLSQVSAEQNELIGQTSSRGGEIKTILPQTQGLMPQASTLDDTAGPGRVVQRGSPSAAENASLLSKLASVQLSSSDIEAILALEPEMQETMLNMLKSVNAEISGKAPEVLTAGRIAEGQLDEQVADTDFQTKAGASGNSQAVPGRNIVLDLQAGIVQKSLQDMIIQHNRAQIRQTATGEAREIALTEEDIMPLAAGIFGGTAQGDAPANMLRGSITNLQKVNELPYALYIFGNVSAERKGGFEEEADIDVPEQRGDGGAGPAVFLRVSEAIKMASVLHNIYYGGSGRFPLETPWYAPYVRYAVQNGIIREGEFRDFNAFATREETAYIFSGSVPRTELPIINYVTDIPDVTETIGYGARIYLLYRAGVLFKADKAGGFHPDGLMTKTEAAAIIGRIATPSDRKMIV